MKHKLAASLLGLALSLPAVQLHAQQAVAPAPADQGQPAAEVPPQILKLLEPHDLAQMSPEQLKAYEAQLRHAAGMPGLPPELKGKLQAQAGAVAAEIGNRAQAEPPKQAEPQQQAQAEPPKAEPPPLAMKRKVPPPPQPDANAAAPADQGAADAQAAADAKAAAGAKAAADRKAKMAADLKAKADAQAPAEAKQAADAQAAAEKKAQENAKVAANAQAEADAKATADAQAAADANNQAQPAEPPPAPPKAADQSQPPAAQPKPPATPPKQATAESNNQAQPPAEPLAKPLDKPATLAPAAPPPAPPAPDAQKVQQLDANPVDPAAEAKAKAYLGDNADLTKLNDDDLRKRLDDTRELLAANQLSQDTERAVRGKLLKEREVLRQRLATAEAKKEQQQAAAAPAPDAKAQAQIAAQAAAVTKAPPPPPPPPPPAQGPKLNFNIQLNFISPDTPPEQILEDRRPPQDLQISELQRRIQIYDQYVGDDRYDPSYRDYWSKNLAYDREFLSHRMKLERMQRARERQAMQDQYDIEINQDDYYAPDEPRTAFAAEVDNQQLERMLTAAPPKRYNKPQYSVRDIATDPNLRNALPRIEVDTIHFGYNEGFVREEELSHLDNIAGLIEQIVAKYPNEVFMIEGHTDAAGSAAYNLKLSKLRAESVKTMMTTYYNIPAKNLRTIGLGEEYLKIPTADPEPENRRVSLTRITPLLAQGQ